MRIVVVQNVRRYLPVAGLLLLFSVLTISSVRHKSATFDEPLHIAGGYGYWSQNEYKLSTENGNFAQRWATLPLLFGEYKFPQDKHFDNFRSSFKFFYHMGNDPDKMLFLARGMIVLLGILLGLLVYLWSAQLFGHAGGLLSLLLYTFSPTVLAHSRLATSDLAVTLCFTASLWSIRALLQRVNVLTLAANCLALGALFASKMSALIMIPVAAVLFGIRIIHGKELPVEFKGRQWLIGTRWAQVVLLSAVVLLQTVLVTGIVAGFYGFRYSASKVHAASAQPAEHTANVGKRAFPKLNLDEQNITERKAAPVSPLLESALKYARKHHLLPEAYLNGIYVVAKYSLVRPAFFNGRYGSGGWTWFFPYCYLVKTPLPVFVVLLLAALAAVTHWHRSRNEQQENGWALLRQSLYRTAPLWLFVITYWVVAVNTSLNIGIRHLLPVYPATFILAGAAASWFGSRRRWIRRALAAALTILVAESLLIWPNYLAYFNQLVEGPKNGYRHLVDSNLDWGQDLPALKQWLADNGLDNQEKTPVYLSYFGNGNPTYHQIDAERLAGYPDLDLKEKKIVPLQGGVYCISATMLQTVHLRYGGRWNEAYEKVYQSLLGFAQMAQHMAKSPAAAKLFWTPQRKKQLKYFPELQLGRLCEYLRNRQPDAAIGYSILVYRLSELDVQQAMLMPFARLIGSRAAAGNEK
ncbi:ArnT family glycosyltransferase [Desulfoferrobacter suflitae]|uniref:ArnT family glycosyltransferase n=1 Tax=Desulfoferrobacter suflitae TaxID=2865782 RepID=UPI002164BEB0|nr:glycosyltransferase family 39 protein [Desulfoferrobacter suflitae]MCK8603277.1 glycosyltransferase family 39 protein [Desulfoferrobacter suflitae]